MKTEIAQYILSLNAAKSMTKRAEDRSLYEKYLADAAILLALVETEAPWTSISEAVQGHERLWGYTWLVDDAYKEPSTAWEKVKKCLA